MDFYGNNVVSSHQENMLAVYLKDAATCNEKLKLQIANSVPSHTEFFFIALGSLSISPRKSVNHTTVWTVMLSIMNLWMFFYNIFTL